MRTIHLALVGALLSGSVCGPLHADVAPVGGEFQVNTYTTANQLGSQVSQDASGRFVVVWQSGYYSQTGPDGSAETVAGRRFDATGTPLAAEFVANALTLGRQLTPAVAVAPGGDFVVAWLSGLTYEGVGSAVGVFVQGFAADGTRRGGQEQVNTTTAGFQGEPAVAIGPTGDFVVVWTSVLSTYSNPGGGDGDGSGIFGQRFDSAGARIGSEFQVNSYTTGYQERPRISGDGASGFVVVWDGLGSNYGASQDGSGYGVFGRHFDASGTPLGDDFQVNTTTTGDQRRPSIAADPRGGFVVSWQSSSNGYGDDVFAQRFDASAARVGVEFEVSTYNTGFQGAPAVAVDGDGNFLVVWESFSGPGRPDGDDVGIFGQHFASTGETLGTEFQVNSFTTGAQIEPSVTAGSDGNFVVVWQSGYSGPGPQQDGDQGGIFGQRLRTTTLLSAPRLRGERLVLTDDPHDPRNRRLRLRSDDAAIRVGFDTGDDPTVGGATLHLSSAAFDQTYDLPAANWQRRGESGGPPKFRYRDPALLSGPIVEVVVGRGTLRVRGAGAQLALPLAANPDPVTVVFRPGTIGLRHCLAFGGAATFAPDRRFRARNAPAPATCR